MLREPKLLTFILVWQLRLLVLRVRVGRGINGISLWGGWMRFWGVRLLGLGCLAEDGGEFSVSYWWGFWVWTCGGWWLRWYCLESACKWVVHFLSLAADWKVIGRRCGQFFWLICRASGRCEWCDFWFAVGHLLSLHSFFIETFLGTLNLNLFVRELFNSYLPVWSCIARRWA